MSHLDLLPDVGRQLFDGVGGQQRGGQVPEPGAAPQLGRQLLAGQEHVDRRVTGDLSRGRQQQQDARPHLVPEGGHPVVREVETS